MNFIHTMHKKNTCILVRSSRESLGNDYCTIISDHDMTDVLFAPESATRSPVGLSTPSADHESQQPIGT